MSAALRQVFGIVRSGLLRRTMTTTGRMPEKIGSGGKELSLAHQITAFTCISLVLLGPGMLLMLTREKPNVDN